MRGPRIYFPIKFSDKYLKRVEGIPFTRRFIRLFFEFCPFFFFSSFFFHFFHLYDSSITRLLRKFSPPIFYLFLFILCLSSSNSFFILIFEKCMEKGEKELGKEIVALIFSSSSITFRRIHFLLYDKKMIIELIIKYYYIGWDYHYHYHRFVNSLSAEINFCHLPLK